MSYFENDIPDMWHRTRRWLCDSDNDMCWDWMTVLDKGIILPFCFDGLICFPFWQVLKFLSWFKIKFQRGQIIELFVLREIEHQDLHERKLGQNGSPETTTVQSFCAGAEKCLNMHIWARSDERWLWLNISRFWSIFHCCKTFKVALLSWGYRVFLVKIIKWDNEIVGASAQNPDGHSIKVPSLHSFQGPNYQISPPRISSSLLSIT